MENLSSDVKEDRYCMKVLNKIAQHGSVSCTYIVDKLLNCIKLNLFLWSGLDLKLNHRCSIATGEQFPIKQIKESKRYK